MGVCQVGCAVGNSSMTYQYNEKSLGLYQIEFKEFAKKVKGSPNAKLTIRECIEIFQSLHNLSDLNIKTLSMMLEHPFFFKGAVQENMLLHLGILLMKGSVRQKTEEFIRLKKQGDKIKDIEVHWMIADATVIASLILPILSVINAFQKISDDATEEIGKWTDNLVHEISIEHHQILVKNFEKKMTGEFSFIYDATDLRNKYRSKWKPKIQPLPTK